MTTIKVTERVSDELYQKLYQMGYRAGKREGDEIVDDRVVVIKARLIGANLAIEHLQQNELKLISDNARLLKENFSLYRENKDLVARIRYYMTFAANAGAVAIILAFFAGKAL